MSWFIPMVGIGYIPHDRSRMGRSLSVPSAPRTDAKALVLA